MGFFVERLTGPAAQINTTFLNPNSHIRLLPLSPNLPRRRPTLVSSPLLVFSRLNTIDSAGACRSRFAQLHRLELEPAPSTSSPFRRRRLRDPGRAGFKDALSDPGCASRTTACRLLLLLQRYVNHSHAALSWALLPGLDHGYDALLGARRVGPAPSRLKCLSCSKQISAHGIAAGWD